MNSVVRKLRKLRRDPKSFVLDSKFLSSVFGLEDDRADPEPRVLGALDLSSSPALSWKNKSMRNLGFSTLMLVDEGEDTTTNPLVCAFIENLDNFIGFREKTFFLLRVSSSEDDLSSVYEQVVQDKSWHSGLLSKVRNVILVGKYVKYADFFYAANPNIKIIAVATDVRDMPLGSVDPYLDYCLCPNVVSGPERCGSNVVFYKSQRVLVEQVKERILQSGTKPFDYLIPVFNSPGYLEEIDDLNEKNIDFCVQLVREDSALALSCASFEEYIEKLSVDVDFILMRESLVQRYTSFVSSKDVSGLLKSALKDGARMELLCE